MILTKCRRETGSRHSEAPCGNSRSINWRNAYFNFKGFAAWFKHHVGEEMSHAAKLIEYMIERSAAPAVPATKAPKTKYASTLDAMKGALAHERVNTAGIYACLKVAAKADDIEVRAQLAQAFIVTKDEAGVLRLDESIRTGIPRRSTRLVLEELARGKPQQESKDQVLRL